MKTFSAVNVHLLIFLIPAVQKWLRVIRVVGLLLITITLVRQQKNNIAKIYTYLVFIVFEEISKHLKYIPYKTTQKRKYLEFTCRFYKKGTNVFNIPISGKIYAFSSQ